MPQVFYINGNCWVQTQQWTNKLTY